MNLRYGSVCSGVAPQTRDWEALGLKCAWFAEIEKFPSEVLKHHFPEVPNFGDFTRITPEQSGPIDLLVGGTPCQSFSVAGKRAGLDDPRGNLTLEFARLAQRLRPRWLVWENVPGVLSIDGGRTFGTFLGILGKLGYGFAYRILDAQHFGVPQRRRRVFVVGHLGNWRLAAAVLFERESLSGHLAPSREKREGVTHDVAPCIGASGRGFERTGESRGQDPVVAIGLDEEQNAVVDGFGCLKSREKGGGFEGVVAVPEVAHTLRVECFDASGDGCGRGIPLVPEIWPEVAMPVMSRDYKGPRNFQDGGLQNSCVVPVAFSAKDHGADASEDLAPTLRAGGFDKSHANSGNWMAVAFHSRQDPINEPECSLPLEAKGGRAVAIAENQRGELRTSDISPQLSCAGGKPGSGYSAVMSNMAVRRLTPRECERLQGFEDDYTLIPWRGKMAPDGPRYKAIGNSWAVPVLNWLAKRILAVEEITKP